MKKSERQCMHHITPITVDLTDRNRRSLACIAIGHVLTFTDARYTAGAECWSRRVGIVNSPLI